eukprot:8389559-Pyramimonas_sp.AAC.1
MGTFLRVPAATESRGRNSVQGPPRVLLFFCGRLQRQRARRRRASSMSFSAARRAGTPLN